MIPQDRRHAVETALIATFGTAEIDSIQQLTGGLSSDLVYRIEVLGRAYLLRTVTHLERKDPARIFAIMRSAAEAKLAPRVLHSSAEDGVAITDFIQPEKFSQEQARTELPHVLRKLHALPAFPRVFNFATAHNTFIWRFKRSGLLPESQVNAAFAQYKRISSVYPRSASDLVSCHMDLKPDNIVCDGERAWLVDWEAAHVNDRYYDLAIVANFVARGDEEPFLADYFGRPADRYEFARLMLMQQIVHLFYAAVLILFGSKGNSLPESLELASFEDFHRRIWAGEIDLADDAQKVAYGRVHWHQMLDGFERPEFERALAVVGSANGSDFQRLLPDEPV